MCRQLDMDGTVAWLKQWWRKLWWWSGLLLYSVSLVNQINRLTPGSIHHGSPYISPHVHSCWNSWPTVVESSITSSMFSNVEPLNAKYAILLDYLNLYSSSSDTYLIPCMPGVDNHYKPFSEVFKTETTEEHRLSLKRKSRQDRVFLFLWVSSMSATQTWCYNVRSVDNGGSSMQRRN